MALWCSIWCPLCTICYHRSSPYDQCHWYTVGSLMTVEQLFGPWLLCLILLKVRLYLPTISCNVVMKERHKFPASNHFSLPWCYWASSLRGQCQVRLSICGGMIGSSIAESCSLTFNVTATGIGIGGLPAILSIQAKLLASIPSELCL